MTYRSVPRRRCAHAARPRIWHQARSCFESRLQICGVLLAHRTAIEAKVSEIREIEATDFGLFGIVKDKDGASLSVESVLSVKFEDIEAAIWKDVDKPRSTVLFKMKCEAKVIVSNPCVPQFGFPKYQIGGGAKVYSAFSASSETQEKIVPLSFYGQATLVRKGTEWVLEELRIDRRMPNLEDYFELAMVQAPAEVDKLPS